MKNKNYLAFSSVNQEYDFFETFEQAEQYLKEGYEEGIPDEAVNGEDFIAKITHRSKFNETDRKENYKYIDEDDIPEDDTESEAWPYSNEFDVIGDISFEKVNTL